jgi:hypothetical protein
MSIVLENCPFCGGESEIELSVERANIAPTYTQNVRASARPLCTSCGATMPKEHSQWATAAGDDRGEEEDEVIEALLEDVKQRAAEKWNGRA